MIRHIVLFSAKHKDDLPAIYDGLMNLTKISGDLQGECNIEIAYNEKADQIGNDCDIVVYGEFSDMETLLAYKKHPLYEKSTSIVRPMREIRMAADTIAKSK